MEDILLDLCYSKSFVEWKVKYEPNTQFRGQVLEVKGDLVQLTCTDRGGAIVGKPYVYVKDICWIDPDDIEAKRREFIQLADQEQASDTTPAGAE